MAEYINRDQILHDPMLHTYRKKDLLDKIKSMPAADVAPVVHGMWTEIDASYWRWKQSGPFPVHLIKYRHDKCGKVVSKKEDYCPNCGAKMDLE